MDGEHQFLWRDFPALRLDELYDLLRLRQEVFVLEQRSFYLDLDGRDQTARHLLVLPPPGVAEGLLGTLRLLPPPRQAEDTVWIGRVALARHARGRGLGARMMQTAMTEAGRLYGPAPLALSAQAHQQPFYRKFGFSAFGKPYDDGGIQHVDMRKENHDI
ncbi:MAG: GNAT family N-acetyltransferase [Rhodovibrionaceae bacterium]|nr:GNAT family N-acetyltransferase [Rhodovibrionaceae bacterium]